MKASKSLKEIDDGLPNGFHDALLEAVTVSFVLNRAELDVHLLVGNPDAATEEEREVYKRAKLVLSDLVYFVIDPAAPGHEYPKNEALRIDAGEATNDFPPTYPKPQSTLPNDAFVYWFFVEQSNSFIYAAARSATLEWL